MARPALLLAVALSLAASAACSLGGPDRVGGAPTGAVVELRLLAPLGSQEALPFAAEVSKLSKGALRIRVVPATREGIDYERSAIRNVQDGKAELGIVASRAWDGVGVNGPAALGAPLLVDSYPLQERLFTSDLVDTVLQDLPRLGLVGLGIVPGPIRRPFGRSGPLASPDDYAGRVIGTQDSAVADATMRALGARPQRLPRNIDLPMLASVDGIEFQATAIEGSRLDVPGSTLMTNVSLWPRPLVLFAGSAAYDRLSGDQQELLRRAAKHAVAAAVSQDSGFEAESAGNLCRKGNTDFDAATADQLKELRKAVQPVYADLERDPEQRAVIEAVEKVKAELAQPASEIATCTPPPNSSSNGAPTPVDGVWSMDTVRKDAGPEYFDENWGHWVFVFSRGHFVITQENNTSCTWGYGTYGVNGSRMSWSFVDGGGIAPNSATNRPGEYFVYDFSAYRDTLALTPVGGETSPMNFMVHPWRQLSSTPSTDQLSTRCPPPPQAVTGVTAGQ